MCSIYINYITLNRETCEKDRKPITFHLYMYIEE